MSITDTWPEGFEVEKAAYNRQYLPPTEKGETPERKALRAIAEMKLDENTNHTELAAMCIAIAQVALELGESKTHCA